MKKILCFVAALAAPPHITTTLTSSKISPDHQYHDTLPHHIIQLVSYPSRRDTMIFGKTRHVKVKGNADINHVVRVDYYLLNGKDSLVKYVEEVELKTKE